ncbi:MAG: HypC/HybG/HupF family hydrogenase formation chaperone [Terriglobia bacterium]|jgi:hydrogenase expression/formation protein HypC
MWKSATAAALLACNLAAITRPAYLEFVPEAAVGDYVMVHVGFAISRVNAEEAARTYELLEEMGLFESEGLGPASSADPGGGAA